METTFFYDKIEKTYTFVTGKQVLTCASYFEAKLILETLLWAQSPRDLVPASNVATSVFSKREVVNDNQSH